MIVVTGATGKLGRHVVDGLLDRIPARDLAVAVRDPAKAADLQARGVSVRHADYDKPETLAPAFAGADKLLLISANEPGKRLPQHTAVIDAATQAGVKLIAYTSLVRAATARMMLAQEHRQTEEALRASGIPFVVLGNSWYFENYTENLAGPLAQGGFVGSAGAGRISAASRADYAAAAVAVLTTAGHDHKIYELGGDASFTLAELAAEVSRRTGRALPYRDLPAQEYEATLAAAGLPAPVAAMVADIDVGIAHGDLETKTGDLRRLIGRPTQTLGDAVAAAVR